MAIRVIARMSQVAGRHAVSGISAQFTHQQRRSVSVAAAAAAEAQRTAIEFVSGAKEETRPRFVPPTADELDPMTAQALIDFVRDGEGGCVIISGAGLSTASGIPDYRSPNGSYSTGHKPMLHQEFISSEANRQRYWARALPGYSRFYAAQPTEAHKGLAGLERRGWLSGVITQNVDRLHHHAGTKRLVHLHGRGDLVHCRNCGAEEPRLDFHKRLAERNAEWVKKAYDAISRAQMMADADAALSEDLVSGFEVENCSECEVGVVMPSVVFFGGSIPAAIKEEARELIDNCTRVLAIGTSLQTFSSFDLCRTAVKNGKPLGIVCIGDTRADNLATLHVPTTCDDAVARLCSALGDAPGT